ncbi:hypothetical protein [Phytoactinopolyspora limicola]|uniref:hypothetical protein n=1 Tax=Phytoactinopolyspora limicola TaxID=2715536 RepID=UPI001A9C50F9|nr:hypothetical protein [Phytoactinopolyspora limicola]
MLRSREPGVTIGQIARDFGVHLMTLEKGLWLAGVEHGVKPGQTRSADCVVRMLSLVREL